MNRNRRTGLGQFVFGWNRSFSFPHRNADFQSGACLARRTQPPRLHRSAPRRAVGVFAEGAEPHAGARTLPALNTYSVVKLADCKTRALVAFSSKLPWHDLVAEW